MKEKCKTEGVNEEDFEWQVCIIRGVGGEEEELWK